MKHTPGPWHSTQNEIEDSAGRLIATVNYQQDGYVRGNVNLIETAPEMLDALQAAVEILGAIPPDWAGSPYIASRAWAIYDAIAAATPQEVTP